MPQKRHCILHIGTEKTGSTSIQTVMAALREQLPAHGFAYPRAPGGRNHTRLSLYAGDPDRTWAMAQKENRAKGDASGIGESLPNELEKELAALPEGVHTIVLSNEHCHSRLLEAASVQRLKDLLDRFFDSYKIVVYLRRQDELAVSRYSTILRTGGISRDVLPRYLTTMVYFAYDKLLDRWAGIFGREAITARLFGREFFVDGDLIRDFYSVCGLPPLAEPKSYAKSNPSIIPAAQELILRFNRLYEYFPALGQPHWASDVVNNEFAGPTRLPKRADAEAFLAAFEDCNERVRAEYFPKRARLFSDDFSRYPEVDAPLPSDGEVLDVALRLLCRLSPYMKKALDKDIQEKLAQAEAAAGDRKNIETERTMLLDRLAEEPTHENSLRRLFRIALDPADQEQALGLLAKAKGFAKNPDRYDYLFGKLGTARRPGHAKDLEMSGKPPKKKKRKLDAAVPPRQ